MLPEVDLLPKYERSESVFFNIFILGLIVAVIAVGLLGYLYFTTNIDLEASKAQVAALSDEKMILETKISTLNSDETIDFEQVIAYIDSYRTPTSILVDEFIQLLPEHGYLSQFTYNYDSVEIETQFETVSASSTYVADLTKSVYLDEVVIDHLGTFTNEIETEEVDERYEVIPRYNAEYSMLVNHQSFAGEEENDETSISGE